MSRYETQLQELAAKHSREREEFLDRLKCIICLDAEKSCMLLPCKHLMYCQSCADEAILNGHCFFCKKECLEYDRVYF